MGWLTLPNCLTGESSSNLEGSEAADAIEYDQFALAHGRTNLSAEQRTHRLGVWRQNRNLVDAWNAQPNRSYVMGYNRFLDWTQVGFVPPCRAAYTGMCLVIRLINLNQQ